MRQCIVRLKRIGRWRRPVYEIVVVSNKSKVGGGIIFEKLGFYSPHASIKFLFIDFHRLAVWLDKGAVVSTVVGSLLGKLASGLKRF